MKIRKSSGLVSKTIDGETLVITAEHSKCLLLDEVGSAVWNHLSSVRETTLDALVERIEQDYDVSRPRARTDVSFFLQQLADIGVIKISGR